MAHHIHPYLLLLGFILLSHQFLLHSVSADDGRPSCPSSFDCEKLGTMLKFPFSNSSAAYSHCGMFTISCDEQIPVIRMANESSGGGYGEVTHYAAPPGDDNISTVQIYGLYLQNFLTNKSCETFNNILSLLISSPSVSLTLISPNLTFFKCNNNVYGHSSSPHDNHFSGFHSYRSCPNFDLYYNYTDGVQSSIPPEYPTPDCTVIKLPMKPFDASLLDASNPFDLLAANFTLAVHVSADCWNCHQTGGQCESDYQQYFYCSKNNKSHTVLRILATAIPGGLILICLLLFMALFLQKGKSTFFWKERTQDYQNVEAFLKNHGSLSPKRYTYSQVKKMTNSFRVKLGQGGYGCVFKGKLENDCCVVAVKVLKGLKGNGEEFINEVATC